LAEAASLLLAPFSRHVRTAILASAVLYVGVLAACAIYGAIKQRHAAILLAPIAFAIMHHAWGIGFINRLLQHVGGARQQQPVASPPGRY